MILPTVTINKSYNVILIKIILLMCYASKLKTCIIF